MKTVSSAIENAILNKKSSTIMVKAIIDPSRTYFADISTALDKPYDAGDYSDPTAEAVGQCMFYSYYYDKVFTFIVNASTGAISFMESGNATVYNLSLTADPNTKPAAIPSSTTQGHADLYYWYNGLKKVDVDLSPDVRSAGSPSSVSIDGPPSSRWTISAGSPTLLSSDKIILCYKTSKGGIGVAIRIDSNTWKHWDQRFISPNALTETDWTIYTSGVIFDGKYYIYATDSDTGEVKGVCYDNYKDSWSDVFIALAADLSKFNISNALVSNNFVHLAGQYHRTGDYSSAKNYSMILRSSNGKDFSWDRFTLLSGLGYRFHISFDNTNKLVYASDRNCVAYADMSYFFISIPNNRVELLPPNSIISVRISGEQASMIVSAANESTILSNYIKKNNRLELYLGYKTTDNPEGDYIKYKTFIIDRREVIWRDGVRALSLQLISEALWKTNQIAFPFYSEILSKSSQFDNCDSLDKMYVIPCLSGDHLDYMTIDFWNSDEWDGDGTVTGGEPFSWCDYPQSSYQYASFSGPIKGRTCKLNAHPHMTTYPTINGTLTAELYGWETGTTSGRSNSTWKLYAVTAPEDDLEDKTVTLGTLTSTYQNFPKDNYSPSSVGTQSGSYPITFSFSGIDIGHKLLYFGITAENATEGTSIMYLERIEIHSGVKFAYRELTSSTPWSLERPEGETRDFLVSPDTSLQNIMFTTKPYSAFNFNIAAEFGYNEGDSPLSPGTTAWGVVGLAKDGSDYICARYKRQTSKIELCLFRDGKTTLLDSVASSEIYDIMMDHRNGLIRVWYKTTNTWIGPVISHQYDEVTHGVISTSNTGIMHTGIYSAVYPPSFLGSAFAQPYSDGICLTTDQEKSVLDGFPNSGYILIDCVKYQYDSKTTQTSSNTKHYGPIQLRQVTDIGTWQESGVTYEGIGIEIALYKPELAYDAVTDLLIGQSNHHTWQITQSDWTIVHSTAGNPDYLRNRSKHYSESAVDERYYTASISDKCYINHGLLGITQISDQPYYHPNGSLVSIWSTDKIWVEKVTASEVAQDATVEDMLRYLCNTASVETEFPGNWTSSSINVTSTPTELDGDEIFFPGGFDIKFTANITSGNKVAIQSLLKTASDGDVYEFGIKNNSGTMQVYITAGTSVNEYLNTTITTGLHNYRLLVYGEFVSFYADDIILATFSLGEEDMYYPDDDLNPKVLSTSAITITDVTVSELFDWREAIYIESEMSTSNAIGSVIQERPIESYSLIDAGYSFSYKFERDQVSYTQANCHNILEKHIVAEQNSENAGSDALVYYRDIAFVSFPDFYNNEGFRTKVLKLPNIENGAKLAAKLILQKTYEKQTEHTLLLRPDIRLDTGDSLSIEYAISGTGTIVSYSNIIIEGISVNIEEGNYSMSLTGRGGT